MIFRKFLTVLAISWTGIILTAQITPHEAVSQMQKGINMGNTLEAPTIGSWNNPAPNENYFDKYKEAGFDLVRIPVRWDKHTINSSPYTIDNEWLDFVEEVLDWGLARDLFVVVNSHHDDWIKTDYDNPEYRARFDSIWSQISVRFKDKPEKLLFEILNEPKGLTQLQNDEMHQRVLSIIRKTNPTRIVIFQGHEWGGADELVTAAVPEDDYVIGSYHAYSPYRFAMLGEGIWGSTSDKNSLNAIMQNVKNWSDENNVPVFFGEFGAVHTCDYYCRMKNYFYTVLYAQKHGFAYSAWDNGMNGEYEILERDTKRWDDVKDILIFSNAISPADPEASLFQDTIVHLSWANMLPEYDSIHIHYRRSDKNFQLIASLKGDTTSFYDINPFPNNYHYYRINGWSDSGKKHFSHPVRIFMPVFVEKVREFYLGAPATIPGTIEAENFDKGGEGLTYHDTSPANIPGDYRPDEAVDIYDRLGDGFHIGNAAAGEWYEYTVNVAEAGDYYINSHLASKDGGGKFTLKIGETVSDTITAARTFSSLTTAPVTTIMSLDAGEQIMRFSVHSEPLFNIDKIVFSTESSINDRIADQGISFTVYQNNNRDLECRISHNTHIEKLRMYTIEGVLVYSTFSPGQNILIPASENPAGVYIIKAFSKKQAYTKKVVVH